MNRTTLFALLLVPGPAAADGLAAEYPNDAGIGKNPAVLFHDDFEGERIGGAWDEVTRRKGRGATDDTDPVAAEAATGIARGKRSARVQLRKDGHEDATFVKRLRPGHDELFMRYYVRYAADYGYHGHGGGGFVADAGKGGFKGAGKAPRGTGTSGPPRSRSARGPGPTRRGRSSSTPTGGR